MIPLLELKRDVGLQIDLKEFSFPELTMFVGTERNGLNEFDEILTVYAFTGYRKPTYSFLYKVNPSKMLIDLAKAEVDKWNADPVKSWTEALIHFNEAEEVRTLETINSSEEYLKKVRKKLKKLRKKQEKEKNTGNADRLAGNEELLP